MIIALLLSLFTFVELNCENLFDCKDDPLKQDEEFSPYGLYRWTPTRYWMKLNHIGQEILSCGEQPDGSFAIPDLVALCEVENDSVLHDLTRRSLLRNARYEYIMTDSPDQRGIDVALLYSPFSFAPIHSYPIRIEPLRGMRPTRDILYVCGRTAMDDTLHVFVAHSPSRSGGEIETRPHRMAVMERLAQSVDSIKFLSPDANIIVAGDLNESADGPSLQPLKNLFLANLSACAKGRNGAEGTYKYQGRWETIDHILVSQALADGAECRINDAPQLLCSDEEYGSVKPKRNYWQIKWQNGFSDHLPLVARLPVN